MWATAGSAARLLARLFAAARLHINFFQPSFKLKEKHREGARDHDWKNGEQRIIHRRPYVRRKLVPRRPPMLDPYIALIEE